MACLPGGAGAAGLALAWPLFAAPAAAVQIDRVTVGDPGNPADTTDAGTFGAVSDTYRISKHEVTNAQYAELLGAVGASDPNGLYDGRTGPSHSGGITRSGSSGASATA